MGGTRIRYEGSNIAAPGANTDILGTELAYLPGGAKCRVTVVLAVASVFKAILTPSSGSAVTVKFRDAGPLSADCAYTFDLERGSDVTLNFQVETNGIIRYLLVKDVVDEVA